MARKGAGVKNNYGNLVEPWKVTLIVDRAKKRGFKPDEIEEAQQEIVPVILKFRYDPAKSNGATEAAALTGLIDRRLASLRRARGRREKREQAYSEARWGRNLKEGEEIPADALEEETPRALDLQATLAELTPVERGICEGLLEDAPAIDIARGLGVSRYALDRLIENIRAKFEARGLGEWMGAR